MKKAKSDKPVAAKPAKRTSAQRGSAARGKGTPKNVDEYLAAVPDSACSAFIKLRGAIRSAVPKEATEIISYGIPAIRHNGVLVWFAAFSNHCSLFPTASVIQAFEHEIRSEGLTTSKGTIHFPVDKPLPIALVKKLVKARVKESESKNRRWPRT